MANREHHKLCPAYSGEVCQCRLIHLVEMTVLSEPDRVHWPSYTKGWRDRDRTGLKRRPKENCEKCDGRGFLSDSSPCRCWQ